MEKNGPSDKKVYNKSQRMKTTNTKVRNLYI